MVESQCDLLPLTIRCDPPALKKGEPWYALPKGRLHFQIEVGEVIHPEAWDVHGIPPSAASRRITSSLESLYQL